MKIYWKSILAALAGVTAISAGATHDRYDNRYDNSYSYSYDRYGNAYKRDGYYDRYGRYQRYGANGPVELNPAPNVDPSLNTVPEPPRVFTSEAEREAVMRYEYERAQRGDFDGSSPHPLSKNYSPG